MEQDRDLWASGVIDLTDITLELLPNIPENAFMGMIRHIMDEPADQPEAYLGFMSAFGTE